jgi:hypothetical protein
VRPPRYPLEPLARLREKKVDEATQALAGAVATRAKAEEARARAEQRRAAQESKVAAVRDEERAALAHGELRAADLARAGAWEIAVAAEREQLDATVKSAQGKERAARDAEAGAKQSVASRQADADAVEKDRARWHEHARKRDEAKEEEAASEAWRPGRRG